MCIKRKNVWRGTCQSLPDDAVFMYKKHGFCVILFFYATLCATLLQISAYNKRTGDEW